MAWFWADGATEFETISLPTLFVDGQPARAHTQGLEVVTNDYFVTARLENPGPKRAILLRTSINQTRWDIWDVTPKNSPGAERSLDHPGGMQSDGHRLWIPVSESVPHGRSVVRVFDLAGLMPNQAATPSFEFLVQDHIGAVAVAPFQGLVLGANWDTESVYVWTFEGQLKRTLNQADLQLRNLGSGQESDHHKGLAIQDWKVIGDRVFASGLFPLSGGSRDGIRSGLLRFDHFLEPRVVCRSVNLPRQGDTETAREAMAISEGFVYFLPADLGTTNRLYRTVLTKLFVP